MKKQINVTGFDIINDPKKPVWFVYLTCGHTKRVLPKNIEKIQLTLTTRCAACEKKNRKRS